METYKRKSTQGPGSIDKKAMVFFVPYWIISFLLSLVAFVVLALLYIFTPLPGASLTFLSRIAVIASELLMAFVAGKYSRFPAVISGGIFGLGYAIIFLFIGLITFSISLFSIKFLLMLITGILFGILGASVGESMETKNKRRRRKTKF